MALCRLGGAVLCGSDLHICNVAGDAMVGQIPSPQATVRMVVFVPENSEPALPSYLARTGRGFSGNFTTPVKSHFNGEPQWTTCPQGTPFL